MTWRNNKVVVTGGAGFLGSHLCQALVDRGAHVTVVDDFSFGSLHNLEAISKDIRIVRHCLGGSSQALDRAMKWDVLFHLAAVADPRKCKEDFNLAFQSNVIGAKCVLAGWNGNGRVIFLSSASVYGDPDYVPIDEDHPLNGNDPYAITKSLGEAICNHYRRNDGVPVTIVRNFNTFGPRQRRAFLIPTLITQALSDKRIEIWNGDPIRDFSYVSDTVEALLAIGATDRTLGQTINLGGGRGMRVGDLVEKIAGMFEVPVVDLHKAVPGSVELVCDNRRVREVTGWEPRVTMDSGLAETITYYQHLAERGEPS